MADFDLALPCVLSREGFYTNDPNDKGGETYEGISRKNWPSWPGWKVIDALPSPPLREEFIPGLSKYVGGFYRENFWTRIRGDEIESQRIATYLFDTAVLFGVARAVKMLQKIVRVKADGVMGPKTIREVNMSDPGYLYSKLMWKRIESHIDTVKRDLSQMEYLEGWIRRAVA